MTLDSKWLRSVLVAAGFALTGCSSLPTIAADLRHVEPEVQLVGAGGPLTPERSRAILDKLQASGAPTDIFDRHLALEEAVAGNPLTVGNRVTLLKDGPATYRAMLSAIEGASDHVNMESYIFEDDEVGRQFAAALVARQQQGVQVNLIRDSIGTLGTPTAFFDGLSASGIQVLEFNPVNPLVAGAGWVPNQRDHRKLLIVDGRIAFLGGINISSVNSGGSFRSGSPRRGDKGGQWRDTDLQIEGPVVASLQRLFIQSWASQHGPAMAARNYFPPPQTAGHDVVRAIGSSPEEPFSQIYATLLSAINSAETSVHLTNAYFVPDPQLLTALEGAVARGVAVRLILPASTDSWLVFHAGRRHYDRLLAAGVKIYERRGRMLHSKTALVDGVWATVGSTNLDWRSFLHNHELNAVVLGREFGAQLQAMFDSDLKASDAVLLEAWRQRGLAERLQEIFASAWAYWL
jgi:cardiolipin synthase